MIYLAIIAIAFARLNTSQIILVETAKWGDLHATLNMYQYSGSWNLVDSFPVNVGISGMGWGESSYTPERIKVGPLKQEGDMRAPAGVFPVYDAFGEASVPDANFIKLRYFATSKLLRCVDDSKSQYYNKFLIGRQVDWASDEQMWSSNGLYKWGLVVEHNTVQITPTLGSCVFFHIWRGYLNGTSGCTAMEEPNLLKLLNWLDPKYTPFIIQVPMEATRYILEEYPELNRIL
jgi:D-alanyl-D-alanine dipeptidase